MKKPFYTEKKINELRLEAQFYKLKAPKPFWAKSALELQYVCNGAGPEDWSVKKREALTAALKPYEACVAIHDVDYEYKEVEKSASDRRFKKNMLKVWKKKYGFFRWLNRGARVERLIIIPAVYAAVVLGGKDAWEACDK